MGFNFFLQMLARSEDEFKKFERMDNERIMKNAGRPRLMEESELPAFLWFVLIEPWGQYP